MARISSSRIRTDANRGFSSEFACFAFAYSVPSHSPLCFPLVAAPLVHASAPAILPSPPSSLPVFRERPSFRGDALWHSAGLPSSPESCSSFYPSSHFDDCGASGEIARRCAHALGLPWERCPSDRSAHRGLAASICLSASTGCAAFRPFCVSFCMYAVFSGAV